MTPVARRRIVCGVLALVNIVCGLVWRLAPLGLPAVFVKYGGSALWAVMVYWLVAFVLPRKTPRSLGFLAAVVAVAVECFKLYHSPGLDAFRLTLAGKLLLGRVFSVRDIVVYWLAIVAAVCLDAFVVSRAKSGRQQVHSPSTSLRVGMTSQKDKGKSRFPAGMTNQKSKHSHLLHRHLPRGFLHRIDRGKQHAPDSFAPGVLQQGIG